MNGRQRQRHRAGFTLLEVVVTIILIGLLGTLLVQVLGTGVQRSAEPIVSIQTGYRLVGVMDRITADYEEGYRDGRITFAQFKTDVDNGHRSDQTPYYGDYTVETAYIAFQDGVEVPDTSGGNRLLRIRLSNGGQAISAVFAR